MASVLHRLWMPTIVFMESSAGAEKRVEAPGGGDLVDLCDAHYAPIPFSCRSASCATCQIEVMDGAELLEAPDDVERDLLELLDGPDHTRLACQARVRPVPGLLRIKPLGS